MKKLGSIKNGEKNIFPLITTRPRTMTFAEYQLLTPEQRQGEIIISDYPVSVEDDYVEVIGDGVKTYAEVLADLLNLLDTSKLTTSSILRIIYTNGTYEDLQFEYKGSPTIRFYNTYTNSSNTLTGTSISLGTTCYYNSTSGSKSSTECTNGEKIRIYYNSTKTLELGTLAQNCMMSNGNNLEQVYSERVTSGSGTSISIEIYKYGKIVYVMFGNGNYTASANETLATIPERFRPIAYVDFRDTFSDKRIRIKPDGTVFCTEALSNEIIRGSLCYITN